MLAKMMVSDTDNVPPNAMIDLVVFQLNASFLMFVGLADAAAAADSNKPTSGRRIILDVNKSCFAFSKP